MPIRSIRGFTLIELLVVIAIIGILASVVLAQLNTARERGVNAAIRANMTNTRSQAALYYDDAGRSYFLAIDNTACINGPGDTPKGIAGIIAAADAENGAGTVDCNVDADRWAVAAQLIGESSGSYYCSDSEGFGGDLVGTVGVEFAADALSCN